MLRLELAHRLRDGGLEWSPVPGDRFVVPERDMDDEVFVISDFTVELYDLPSGLILGFNGTTEWALDSMTLEQVLWLPREDQLRTLLGSRFRRLQAVSDEWVVVATTADGEASFLEPDVESAYASAVLAVLPEVLSDAPA
jgi:hypothetical protein